ncbi:hypothetical protein V8E54_000986 [Elaphomyces granulatus]
MNILRLAYIAIFLALVNAAAAMDGHLGHGKPAGHIPPPQHPPPQHPNEIHPIKM